MLLRIETLAAESTDPKRQRLRQEEDPETPARIEPDSVELSLEGVSIRPAIRRKWKPIDALADELIQDTVIVLEAAGHAIVRRLEDEAAPLPLDRLLEAP